ncbi:MAG TPA: glycosyltransferase, partial [Candidatus Saccharibacteria bacterium]|nr:glycosyltransferase [Candidatus Saccharibacteria bacterium]
GGERVIKAVHELFPDAPIYTSQYRPRKTAWLVNADVRVGWLNVLPAWSRRLTPFLRQWYFSRLDLNDYNLVISITGAEAKSVKTRDDALHVSYMHAPTQYYWTLYDDYMANPGFGFLNPLARFVLKLLVEPLRRADYAAAQRPDVVVANSSYIRAEIKKHYGRESVVVWPNVAVEVIQAISEEPSQKRNGFIVYGRQVSWKRIDLAIDAVLKAGEHLYVVGDGPEHERLVELAGGSPSIEFLPRYRGVAEIVPLIRASKAFLFPSIEPFGIAPVEALAAGTPVIALQKGGSLDFIQEGKNGVFFDEQTIDSLAAAMQKFNSLTFDTNQVAASAKQFSETEFKQRLNSLINESLGV